MFNEYAEVIPTLETDTLKELLDMIQTELQERKNEREKIQRQYQKELDRLLEAMDGDGFYVDFPDHPSNGLEVMDRTLLEDSRQC